MSAYHTTLVVIGAIVAIGVLAIVLLDQKADGGTNVTTITMLIGFLAPTIAALLGLAKMRENEEKIDRIETKVDTGSNKIDNLHGAIEKGLNGVQEASLDAGIREGKKIEKERHEKDEH